MLTTPFKRIRTAGRVQGAGRSLSMRRVWYSADPKLDAQGGEKKEDPSKSGDVDKDTDDDGESDEADEDALAKLSSQELAARLRATRREAAGYRTKLRGEEAEKKRLLDEKTKAERERATADAKKLEEQGEYKTLYEQQQAAIVTLKAKADQADAYEQKLQVRNEDRVKAIPDSHVKLVPKNYTPADLAEWLDANETLWKKPEPPNFDAGKKGDRKPPDKSHLKPMKM